MLFIYRLSKFILLVLVLGGESNTSVLNRILMFSVATLESSTATEPPSTTTKTK